MSTLAYLSSVSNMPSGFAGSAIVTAQVTNGTAAPAADSSATTGTIHETSTAGTYICLVSYPSADVAPPALPWAHWSINGVAIDDPSPIPMFVPVASLQGPYKANVATGINFSLVSTADYKTPVTGATITAQRSIAGGAFANVAGIVAEIGSGAYRLAAAAADMNGVDLIFKFTAAGAATVVLTVNTTP